VVEDDQGMLMTMPLGMGLS